MVNSILCRAVGRRSIRPLSGISSTCLLRNTSCISSHFEGFNIRQPRRQLSDVSVADKDPSFSSPKLQTLYDRVLDLPEEEVNVLGAMVLQILGRTIFPGEFGTPGGAAVADGGGAPVVEEVVEEKTAFDVKLLGFDAKAKIKVIKEVRAIAGLGLKEAKELVESAPKVISKDLKPEAAEELKEKFEALGAQIEIV